MKNSNELSSQKLEQQSYTAPSEAEIWIQALISLILDSDAPEITIYEAIKSLVADPDGLSVDDIMNELLDSSETGDDFYLEKVEPSDLQDALVAYLGLATIPSSEEVAAITPIESHEIPSTSEIRVNQELTTKLKAIRTFEDFVKFYGEVHNQGYILRTMKGTIMNTYQHSTTDNGKDSILYNGKKGIYIELIGRYFVVVEK